VLQLLREHSFASSLGEIIKDFDMRHWTKATIPDWIVDMDITKLVTPRGNSRFHVEGPAYKEDPEVCRILSEIAFYNAEIERCEQQKQDMLEHLPIGDGTAVKKGENYQNIERDLQRYKSILKNKNGLIDASKKAESAVTKRMCELWLQPIRDFNKKLAAKSPADQESLLNPPSDPSFSSDCELEVVAAVDGAVSQMDSPVSEHSIPYHSKSALDLATLIGQIGTAYQCYEEEFTSNDFDGRLLQEYACQPAAQLFIALSEMNVRKELHRRRIHAELTKLWAPLKSTPLLALRANDVAAAVGELGDSKKVYKKYQQSFVDNGFDGTMLSALIGVSDPDVLKLLENDLEISMSMHRQKILTFLKDLRLKHSA